MSHLLAVKNIETYYGLVYAIRGASFTVDEGSITAILGNNGAGKSTILKTVMGLIEDQPDKGAIEYDGIPIQGWDTDRIVRQGIAYVPEGREIFEELTVLEHLAMGAFTRRGRAGVKQDMEQVFAYFPVLEKRTHQWAGTLSGGEQQMLAMGRALMLNPRLLILDEPSLGLSPILVKEIFSIIQQINKKGTTILLVEQNARMALSISHTGLILENGRFVMKGRSQDLLKDKDVQEFYLGIKSETSAKGYQRWKRKKAWR
ncbi:MAG: ABC transporter ATP-binding protein [Desulfotignum sp.]|nr:ABC transporter ATP-binding protein [Desulfotignum sp.]MCF8112284.1 ABC transporter ATP-binding protein [Desulfotignum sp.]MCF8124662.1 ABC transporter ATP-binding protein [Desulfotignum sp.]